MTKVQTPPAPRISLNTSPTSFLTGPALGIVLGLITVALILIVAATFGPLALLALAPIWFAVCLAVALR